MKLPAEIEAKIEEIANEPDGSVGMQALERIEAGAREHGAREMAEWLMEMVFEYCGEHDDDPGVEYHCESDEGFQFGLVTRAQFLSSHPQSDERGK